MKRLVTLAATLAVAVIAAKAAAQVSVPPTPTKPPSSTSTTNADWPYWDLHNHNRAIAFGSLILAGNGGHADQWKEVRAYTWCTDGSAMPVPAPTQPLPIPDPKPFDGGDEPASGGGDDTNPNPGGILYPCDGSWEVMYTTSYNLVECPDGRAYIVRGGEGVDLKSKTEGDVFAWSEAVACDDDIPGGTSGSGSTTDPHRPLNVKKLERRAL